MNASSSSVTPGQTVTLTAQVASATTGTPTGSVTFYDGTTLLGTVPLTAGTATMSTGSLTPGSANTLQAVYSGDNNFTTSTSSTSSVTVASLDFTVAVLGSPSNTVQPGSVATYQVAVTPLYGNYPGPVSFAASGLPSGASITFSPSTIAFDGGKQTIKVTVQTPALGEAGVPGNWTQTGSLNLGVPPDSIVWSAQAETAGTSTEQASLHTAAARLHTRRSHDDRLRWSSLKQIVQTYTIRSLRRAEICNTPLR